MKPATMIIRTVTFLFLSSIAAQPSTRAAAQSWQGYTQTSRARDFTDCTDVQNPLDRAGCIDPRLNDLLSRWYAVTERLASIVPDSERFWEYELQKTQKDGSWFASNVMNCHIDTTADAESENVRSCLIERFAPDVERLEQIYVRRIMKAEPIKALISRDSDSRATCAAGLSAREIVNRTGNDGDGGHSVRFDDPPEITKPEWTALVSHRDHLAATTTTLSEANIPLAIRKADGRTESYGTSVFRFTREKRIFTEIWYVVPKPAFVDAFRLQWQTLMAIPFFKPDYVELIGSTRHPRYNPESGNSLPAKFTGSGDENSAALYEVQNSSIYLGNNADSDIIIHAKRAYLRGYNTSMVALFEFDPSGELIPICWERFGEDETPVESNAN